MRILGKAIELLLVEVAAGCEEAMAKHLLDSGYSSVYKAFGKYDVMALAVTEEPAEGVDALTSVAHAVVDFQQAFFFLWDLPCNNGFSQLTDRNWSAFSLLKVNPEWLVREGTEPVVALEQAVESLRDAVAPHLTSFALLGGLGWHELALLAVSDDLGVIGNAVSAIGAAKIEGTPVLTKTFTLIGADGRLLTGEREWSELNDTTEAQARQYLFVSGVGVGILSESEALGRELGAESVEMVFGAEDLLLPLNLQMGDFGAKLLSLRKQRKDIYTTSTLLTISAEKQEPPDQRSFDTSDEGRTPSVFDELLTRATTIDTDSNDEVARDLRRLYSRLSVVLRSSLSNPITADAYLDMLPALGDLAAVLTNDRDLAREGDPLPNPRKLRDILSSLSTAYQQRCLGVFTSLWNVGNPVPVVYRGGIHTVLKAAEYLVDHLFQASPVPHEWHGFATFGVTRDYLRTHLGIINIPAWAWLRPEEWWGIFHEAGHEYLYQIYSFNRQAIADAARALAHLPVSTMGPDATAVDAYSEFETEEALHQLWEYVADIFDIEYGFGNDWCRYKAIVVPYILRTTLRGDLISSVRRGYGLKEGSYVRAELEHYITRLFTTWAYSSIHTRTEDLQALAEAFSAEMDEMLTDWMRSAVIAAGGDDVLVTEVGADLAAILRDLSDIYQRCVGYRLLVERPQFIRDLIPRCAKTSFPESEYQAIRDGQILTHMDSPEAVLVSLKIEGPEWASRAAFIMSCWNGYMKRLPVVVTETLRRHQERN